MAVEIIFSGGHGVIVTSTDEFGLMQNLTRLQRGESVVVHGRQLPHGFVDVNTEDGVIYVNPDQVAYLREVSDEQIERAKARAGGRPITAGILTDPL